MYDTPYSQQWWPVVPMLISSANHISCSLLSKHVTIRTKNISFPTILFLSGRNLIISL